MSFHVRLARGAVQDLERLFDFVVERELARPGGGDLDLAQKSLDAVRSGMATLRTSPFTCRKAGSSAFLRELIIPFGRTGHVALFEIEGAELVTMVAARHQLEGDYH